jgi:ADP-heptose:LPS heptosyltransferase
VPKRNTPTLWINDPDLRLDKYSGWACITRWGGIGDIIQATSLLPGLRKQGYKVAWNIQQGEHTWVREDPNVDLFVLQRKNLVSNEKLPAYWKKLGQFFDKHVQLCGSIEGTLLLHPNVNRDYLTSSHEERHAKMNKNYLEHIHEMAGLPFEFAMRFYPDSNEVKWAKAQEKKFRRGGRKIVLISLSGSSVHKVYPYWDKVIQALGIMGGCTVVTVGDVACQILEIGWEKFPFVKRRSGLWSVRQTLTFIEHCDVIVGTATGVMNAAGQRGVPKVLMLSHSSVENLSKHWKNTFNIVPAEARCHPCHKMHLNSNTCNQLTSMGHRGAWCAHVIQPEEVMSAIRLQLDNQRAA